MATYNRTDLVRAALQRIGVADPKQPIKAVDFQTGNDRAQQVLELLYEDGLIPFDLDGDIPARYFLPVSYILEYNLTSDFLIPDPSGKYAANAVVGDRLLRRLRQKAYFNQVTQATYF